ncbi:hypothetical protein KBA39_02820 [Myxococcota bacterium]|nr:hypothetical protein [Myxococcota bacterium]
MNQGNYLTRSLAIALLAVPFCLATACSDGTGDPSEDVFEDVAGDVIDQDQVSTPDSEGDESGHQDYIHYDTNVDDPTALELVAAGKEMLSAGESLPAMSAFARALELQPDLQDAMWGMVLGRFQSMVSMWGSLLGLVNFRDDPDAIPTPVAMSLDFPEHPGTIGSNFDSLFAAAAEQKVRLEALKAAGQNPVFNLPGGLPLTLKDDLVANLCCDWDLSDVYGISSFNNLMLAFISFMGSQNTDIPLIFFEDSMDSLPGIENTIVATLDEFPDALTLLPETGDDIWKSTKDFLAASIDDALESARLMGEGNDLTANVATLSDDEKPYLVLHGTFPSGVTEMEFLWEGKTASMKAVLEKAKAHLAGTADSRLSLDADVLVALGVLVDIINRTVGIQTVVEGLGIELPDIVTGLMSSLDPADPEQLVGLLGSMTSLLGIQAGAVELDIATFLDSPFNLRDMLPWYGEVPGATAKYFLRSFECVRGGAEATLIGAGNALAITIHDPSRTDASFTLDVVTNAGIDGAGAEIDRETVTFMAAEGFTGLFQGNVLLEEIAGATPADDGYVALPPEALLTASYQSTVDPARAIVISGNLTDGFTEWNYAGSCTDETTPWDAGHFEEAEFADAVEVHAPGQTTDLPAILADGKSVLGGSMAFRSPSFDGLLWLKNGEELAPATQETLAGFVGGILTALEGF